MKSKDLRILIADKNNPTTHRLASYLKDSGFQVQCVFDGIHVADKIMEIRPHFILIDIAMPDFSGFKCLDFLNEKNLLANNETRVFILSGHNSQQNVEACLKKGAHDYIVRPIDPMDVLTRIALHWQANRKLKKIEEIKNIDHRQANYYLHMVELLIRAAAVKTATHQINYQLLRMLSLPMNAVRVSLIDVSRQKPTVIASSDNAGFTQFPLDMEKYPEVAYVARTQKPLFIENVSDDAVMSFIADQIKTVFFNTMIVVPICSDGVIHGVLSVRMAEASHLSDADIRLCQVVAQIFCNYWHLQGQIHAKAS
jgi:DNA-binding response OmpR family regulator